MLASHLPADHQELLDNLCSFCLLNAVAIQAKQRLASFSMSEARCHLQALLDLRESWGSSRGVSGWVVKKVLTQAVQKHDFVKQADYKVNGLIQGMFKEAAYLVTGERFQQHHSRKNLQSELERCGKTIRDEVATREALDTAYKAQILGLQSEQNQKTGLIWSLSQSLAASQHDNTRLQQQLQGLTADVSGQLADAAAAVADAENRYAEGLGQLELMKQAREQDQLQSQGMMEAAAAKVLDLEHERQQQLKTMDELKESLSASQSSHQRRLADAAAAAAAAESRHDEDMRPLSQMDEARQQDQLKSQSEQERLSSEVEQRVQELQSLKEKLESLELAGETAPSRHKEEVDRLQAGIKRCLVASQGVVEAEKAKVVQHAQTIHQLQESLSGAQADNTRLMQDIRHQAEQFDVELATASTARLDAENRLEEAQAKVLSLELAGAQQTSKNQADGLAKLECQHEQMAEVSASDLQAAELAAQEETANRLQEELLAELEAQERGSSIEGPDSPDAAGEGRPKLGDESETVTPEPSEAGNSDQVQDLKGRLANAHARNDNINKQLWELKRMTQIPHLTLSQGWQVKQELGHGMSGSVSRVTSQHYPNCVLKKGYSHRMEQEAHLMRFLNHTNVARLYAEVATDELSKEGYQLSLLALQRLGPSLRAMMRDTAHPMSVREMIVGFQGLAAGVAHIHSRGLVDQDLHFENVLRSLDGCTWVKADLGSAVWTHVDNKPNRIHRCLCGVGLEAPEMADSLLKHGWYEPNPSSDVWALGLLMLDVVRGQRAKIHDKLFRSPALLEELKGDRKMDTSPAVKEYYSYLQSLLPDHGQLDYAQQVKYPQGWKGSKTSAKFQFKEVIKSCLHSAPEDRPTASQVQANLHAIMQQQGWSDDLTEQPASETN